MTTTTIPRPTADEHVPYFGKYIERVPDGDLLQLLREQVVDTAAMLRGPAKAKADFAYGPGKWTVKQVVGHMIDTERVMTYRALRFARNDPTDLAGFDENTFVANANFTTRSLDDLTDELEVVRAATTHFVASLDSDVLTRGGTANGNFVTVRALLYVVAGHERHHVALLHERYLIESA